MEKWINPSSKDGLQHTISVYNQGNKEIKNLRVKVCAINQISNIEGNVDFGLSIDNKCFEISREMFLEKDEIVLRFSQKIPLDYKIDWEIVEFENKRYNVLAWNDGQIEALRNLNVTSWSLDEKQIDQIKIFNTAVIIIPNCYTGL